MNHDELADTRRPRDTGSARPIGDQQQPRRTGSDQVSPIGYRDYRRKSAPDGLNKPAAVDTSTDIGSYGYKRARLARFKLLARLALTISFSDRLCPAVTGISRDGRDDELCQTFLISYARRVFWCETSLPSYRNHGKKGWNRKNNTTPYLLSTNITALKTMQDDFARLDLCIIEFITQWCAKLIKITESHNRVLFLQLHPIAVGIQPITEPGRFIPDSFGNSCFAIFDWLSNSKHQLPNALGQ